MKNLLITESCLIGGEHVEAGTKLPNVENSLAAELITAGRATVITGDHEVIGNRDPAVGDRDPGTGSGPATKQAKKSAKKQAANAPAETPPEGDDTPSAE